MSGICNKNQTVRPHNQSITLLCIYIKKKTKLSTSFNN